jgi:hypothetical protein
MTKTAKKPIIRTITVEWLKKNSACEEGISLFKHIVGGDRVTMRFTAEDLLWMKENFYDNKNTGKYDFREDTAHQIFRIPEFIIPRYRAYLHVKWLYGKIAGKLPEFKAECIRKGIYL